MLEKPDMMLRKWSWAYWSMRGNGITKVEGISALRGTDICIREAPE